MIALPNSPREWTVLTQFLNHYSFVQPSADLQVMGWVVEDDLKMVVGFNAFLGKTCQMHVAMKPDWKFTPKLMLRASFEHAFNTRGCELVLGIVNSFNEEALTYDHHLGFEEMWRLPKMHDEGGDIVVLGMRREMCRYIAKVEELQSEDTRRLV
jgi:hypothetical protein